MYRDNQVFITIWRYGKIKLSKIVPQYRPLTILTFIPHNNRKNIELITPIYFHKPSGPKPCNVHIESSSWDSRHKRQIASCSTGLSEGISKVLAFLVTCFAERQSFEAQLKMWVPTV